MKRLITALLLSSCDLVDLDIEDPANCCLMIGEPAIRGCFEDFVEPGFCRKLECPTVDLFEPKGCDEMGWEEP